VWGTDLSGSPQGAGGVGGLLEVSSVGTATTNCFVAYDGNGNVAALVNAADGTVVGNYEYGPFGEVIRATGPMAKANPLRFSTKYDDDESDLLYYGYRYYKPSTGTWANRDPMEEEGGLNSYGLVDNDAMNYFDPLGLQCREINTEREETIPLEGFSFGYDIKASVKHCDDCCTYIHVDLSGELYGGERVEEKGVFGAGAGFKFGYDASAQLTVGSVRRSASVDLTICPGRISAGGRTDLSINVAPTAYGEGSVYALFGNFFDLTGTAKLGIKADAILGLAAVWNTSDTKCIDVKVLGSGYGQLTGDLFVQGKAYVRIGKWNFNPVDFTYGWSDKDLGHGGFKDMLLWNKTFCL